MPDPSGTSEAFGSPPSIGDEALLAYAAGELSGEALDLVERALGQDPIARRFVALWRLTAQAVLPDPLGAPSAGALERLRRIPAAVAHVPQSSIETVLADLWGRLQHVIAELVQDSRQARALAGLRGEPAGAAFHCTYRGAGTIVDVQFAPMPPGAGHREGPMWSVVGQVEPEHQDASVRDAEIALVPEQSDSPALQMTADEHGIFRGTVAPMRGELCVRLLDEPDRHDPAGGPRTRPTAPRVLRLGPIDLSIPGAGV